MDIGVMMVENFVIVMHSMILSSSGTSSNSPRLLENKVSLCTSSDSDSNSFMTSLVGEELNSRQRRRERSNYY